MRKNVIINFHVVKSKEWFESVVLLLKSKFEMVDLAFFENSENYARKKGFCHLTFDDGERSFYDIVFPVITKYKVPVSVFVSPQSIENQQNFWFEEIGGYDNQVLKNIIAEKFNLQQSEIAEISALSLLKCLNIKTIWAIIELYRQTTSTPPKPYLNIDLQQLKEINNAEFVTIGGHTQNHPILKNETDKTAENEIVGSIKGLEQILEREIRYFAYPNGTPDVDFGDREMQILQKCGIKIAVSTEKKYISFKDDKLAFPRMGLTGGSIRFIKLKLLLGNNYDKLKQLFGHSKELKNRGKFEEIKNRIVS